MAIHINYLAVFLAALASFGFGAVWYMTLGERWMAALGATKEMLKARHDGRVSPFIVSILSLILMAFVLAGLIAHFGTPTIRNGLLTGLFCWAGFVLTTVETNHAFNGARRALTLIDAGHWLGVLLVQGLIIGAMG